MECEIWEYGIRGWYKVLVTDAEMKRKLLGWKDCESQCRYSRVNDLREIGWDFLFPGEIYDRVAKLVGLPPRKKSASRVEHGKKVGKMAVDNDHLKLKASGEDNLIAPVNE